MISRPETASNLDFPGLIVLSKHTNFIQNSLSGKLSHLRWHFRRKNTLFWPIYFVVWTLLWYEDFLLGSPGFLKGLVDGFYMGATELSLKTIRVSLRSDSYPWQQQKSQLVWRLITFLIYFPWLTLNAWRVSKQTERNVRSSLKVLPL